MNTVKNLNIKKYDSSKPLHQDLSTISKQFHKAIQIGDNKTVEKLEDQLDKLAARYWKLQPTDLQHIRNVIK